MSALFQPRCINTRLPDEPEIDPIQRHVGIAYRQNGSSQVFFLHLAWHRELRDESLRQSYAWVDPRIPTPRLRQVAARCRQVIRNNSHGIPYAFSSASESLDRETGRFLLGPTRLGLTCATFVLAVFQSTGPALLRPETWPTGRPDDRRWQESVISMLESISSASEEHLEAVRNEVGAVRIRPEDVAAAAVATNHPVAYQDVADRAEGIVERIGRH